jgi:multicomponent Na+:H+ antiporter subunit E
VAVKSDLVLVLAVNIINLIPGSIVLEIDQARRMLYVHVIDVGSERAVSRFYSQVAEVERLLVSTFERVADWRPSADKETA